MAISTFLPKAPEITDWTIVTRTAVVNESDSTEVFAVDFLSSAQVLLVATDDSGGTSPTLDVSIEQQNADGATYSDVARFPLLTSTNDLNPNEVDFVHSGNSVITSSASIASGTVRTINMGGWWRINWTMSGTWTFSVYGNFKA
jgi:hypothetical protein